MWAVLLVSVPGLAASQELLPASLGDWATSRAVAAGPQEIEKLAGEDAAILREYGVTGAEQRTYSRGGRTVEVTVFLFPDSTTAFGAFSFLRTDAVPAAVRTGTSGHRRKVERALLGNFILDFTGDGLEEQRNALKALQKQLLVWADGAPYPLLVQYLPTEGLVRGSERFMLAAGSLARVLPTEQSDWVGFRYGAEAQLARFRTNGKETALLLISYPTPQAAQLKQAELGRWFNVNNAETAPTDRPVVYVRRILSVLAIALEADSAETAKALLEKVQYQPNFSWNEPGHRATDQPILYTIYHMMVGIGVLLAFALVAGISFGGVRIVTKYFFPGKVFDRAETMEILQLGLGSKPIEAKDFY
ncbi:MAG: hypothetical protein HY234_07365 [Acidobacteria bacterium]|nr:hypothetical protein [Acidobacteriota bacterium]MBI3662852.1 hypothetical protein [Acidobacteriota bacterium]